MKDVGMYLQVSTNIYIMKFNLLIGTKLSLQLWAIDGDNQGVVVLTVKDLLRSVLLA